MPRRRGVPSYRLHRPSGQAVVTLSGKDLYLGPHGSETSRAEYDRLVMEWLSNGRRAEPEPVAPTHPGPLIAEEVPFRCLEKPSGWAGMKFGGGGP